MGQTDLKPTAQGQVESSINDTINFIMAKVAAGEIDAATATELIAAARKDYESNVPVTTSAQQAVQPQQTANPYQADPQTAYAVPEMEPEQTPIDYGQFATSTNYPHTYDVEDSSDVDMDALSGIASDVFDKQPRKKLSRKERKARAKEMKKLQKESNAKLKANAKSNKSIQKQLKDRDKELSKKNEFARYRRKTAKDVTSFIGYNRMYEDGICEVEEGMFSSCICFEDTSYHSVREDAQKAVFTSICRLYDQFGADTLVQFNIINTPLLKEQIMAAFSPLPFALLGFDETKNYGVSFCKNFLATCLAGVIILFAMGLFPNLLSGFSGGEISGFKGDMWSSVCASVALMLIVIKSGTIARDVFGG